MMFFGLFKVLAKENLSFTKVFGLKNKGKNSTRLNMLAFLALYLLMIVSLTMSYIEQGQMFADYGISLGFFLKQGAVMAVVFTALAALQKADGSLFHYKDHSILAPLPIPQFVITVNKIIIFLLFQYFVLSVFLVPIGISYFYFEGIRIIPLLSFVIGFLFLPIIPITVFSFLSLLLSKITRKLPHKNIFQIVFLFIIVLLLMVGSFILNSGTGPSQSQLDFFDLLIRYFPPLVWFVESITAANPLYLLYLVLINVAFLAGFTLIANKVIVKTNQEDTVTVVTRGNHKARIDNRPLVIQLLKKEIRTFFSIPIYALNTGMGSIMMLILPVVAIIIKGELTAITSALGLDPGLFVMAVYGFCISTIYTPAISLSLEGKNFWFLKSLPIKAESIFMSKIIFNLTLILPFMLVGYIPLVFVLGINILYALMYLAILLLFALLISSFGMILNLYFPKFDYMNPTEVVKQSLAAFFGIFGGFILAVLSGLIIIYSLPLGLGISLLLAIAFLASLCAASLAILKKAGLKKYYQMEVL